MVNDVVGLKCVVFLCFFADAKKSFHESIVVDSLFGDCQFFDLLFNFFAGVAHSFGDVLFELFLRGEFIGFLFEFYLQDFFLAIKFVVVDGLDALRREGEV